MHKLPPLFDCLPDQALRYVEFESEAVLFRQGDLTKAMYFLEQGIVTLSRWGAMGEQIMIHTAHAGESFAEAALFSENYHCDARTKTPSGLWVISKPAVLEAFATEPEFALGLTSKFASQVQTLRRQKELLAIRSAPERVYAGICEGLLSTDIKLFAASIGLAHETVYRALAKLVAEKRLLKTARGSYERPEGRPQDRI